MGIRGRLTVRLAGLLAGASLAVSAALTATAPAAGAVTRAASTAGPAGVGARSAAVENAATGHLLWSRGLNTERPIASITKVMTAFLVIRAGHLDRTITIPAAVTGYVRSHNASNAGLHPGDKLTARQLLYGLMLPSGADAAYALAQAYGPGIPAFVARMNAMARRLGMGRTHFSNFDGLPYPTRPTRSAPPAWAAVWSRCAPAPSCSLRPGCSTGGG
jgi:serine-type D-Ala-D-Ala carboxypeptidase (penicillin-binding protein 5/6)